MIPPKTDWIGKRFGRLVVESFAGRRKNYAAYWHCRCDCGVVKAVLAAHLRSGRTQSCGCLQREMTRTRMTVHGHASYQHHTPAYVLWLNMKTRCFNALAEDYRYYGARGITICDRWRTSFQNFYEDMGDPPQGMSIERIDNSHGYNPENCRWATAQEQANNRRSNTHISYRGKTQTLAAWSREMGMSSMCLIQRLKRGWTVERALSTPIDTRKQPVSKKRSA